MRTNKDREHVAIKLGFYKLNLISFSGSTINQSACALDNAVSVPSPGVYAIWMTVVCDDVVKLQRNSV
jgi:hypothetical protein